MTEIEYIGKCLVISTEGKKILVVGDLHLGYEEALNKTGIFVSRKLFSEMLESFEGIFKEAGKIDEIVVLGDIKHDFGNILRQEWEDVLKIVSYFKSKAGRVVIIKGNHDKIIEPIARRGEVDVVDYYKRGDVCFLHGDRDFMEIYEKNLEYWVVGHGHPAVMLKEGIKEEKYKCFLEGKYKGKTVIVVPSFVEHSEGSDPRVFDLGMVWNLGLRNFRVKIVGEGNRVLDFGLLKDL